MTETLSPKPAAQPEAAAAPARRLTGILCSINDRGGYGFLNTGRGKPRFFLHSTELPAGAWVEGAAIEFSPLPPRPGTKNFRAGEAVLLRLPGRNAAEVIS